MEIHFVVLFRQVVPSEAMWLACDRGYTQTAIEILIHFKKILICSADYLGVLPGLASATHVLWKVGLVVENADAKIV